MAYKACSKCQEVKPFTHFSTNGARRRSECRECERERVAERVQKCRAKKAAMEQAPPPPCQIAEAMREWRGPVDSRPLLLVA